MRFSFRDKTTSRIGNTPWSFCQNSVTLGNEKAGQAHGSASSSFPGYAPWFPQGPPGQARALPHRRLVGQGRALRWGLSAPRPHHAAVAGHLHRLLLSQPPSPSPPPHFLPALPVPTQPHCSPFGPPTIRAQVPACVEVAPPTAAFAISPDPAGVTSRLPAVPRVSVAPCPSTPGPTLNPWVPPPPTAGLQVHEVRAIRRTTPPARMCLALCWKEGTAEPLYLRSASPGLLMDLA